MEQTLCTPLPLRQLTLGAQPVALSNAAYARFTSDPSKVGVWTRHQRHRLQSPPAVPPESEEPRHHRLPPRQAEISVGLAQLSPVSFLSLQVK